MTVAVPLALSSYTVVLSFHIMAVLAAYGLPLAYPLLVPYLRSRHPQAMPGVHEIQHRLNVRLTGPGTVVILLLGAYLATRAHAWGKVWVDVPIAILATIAILGGWIVGATARLAAIASTDVQAAAGNPVVWSAEYLQLYRRYLFVEVFLGALVLIAVFFMAAKPFA
jgi:hypothetical protein